jgi:hypothetical protein
MKSRWTLGRLSAAITLAGGMVVSAQILPSEPPRRFGAGITPAYEGWYENPDGTKSFLIGYLNRNRARAVDVPIGPNNRIEPGGPDQGQPTHFLAGRQVGMFIVTVPKEFTPEQRITWTINFNGETNSIPFRMHTDYNVSPFKIQHSTAVDNTPPRIRFEERGQTIQGPIANPVRALTRTTSVAKPLSLNVWAEDDGHYSSGSNTPVKNPPPPVVITWSKYRGPGTVTFEKDKPQLDVLTGGNIGQAFSGRGATTASFSEPGEYYLHMTANDYSGDGGGGEICCWTTVIVKVTVTP